MRTTSIFHILCGLMGLVLLLPANCLAQSSAEIDAAADKLGAPDFAARQAATDLLWRAGPAATDALDRAKRSLDPEVRARATALIERLRLGIRPETPADVTALIEQFRFAATASQRRQALVELQNKGQWQAILTLIRGERDQETRRNLATTIASEAGKLVRPLVERGELQEAEQVLELVALGEAGIPQWTAFLVLTGRLEAALDAARKTTAGGGDADNWKRLAYLERANGNLPDAIKAAENSRDLFLQVNLLAEARQWADAAAATTQLISRNQGRTEGLAFAATFYRLAGNQDAHGQLIQILKSAADKLNENPPANRPQDPFGTSAVNPLLSAAWTAAETLLVNERPADALPILKKVNPRFAHGLLWRQHKSREALEFVQVTAGKVLDRAWLDALPAPPGDTTSQQAQRFTLAAQVARQLRELGRTEQMQQIVDTLRALSPETGDRGRRLSQLVVLEWQLGRYDDVPADAVRAIAAGQVRPSVFASLLKAQGPIADYWYDHWTSNGEPANLEKAFADALWIAAPSPPAGKMPDNWKQLVEQAEADLEGQAKAAKAQRLAVLGQTCEIRGDKELARRYYRQAAELEPRLAIRVADLALAAEDWKAAADDYQRAAQATAGEAIATYLYGYCLAKNGDTEAGQSQMQLASVTALMPEARLPLATGLQERKLKSAALEQLALMRRTALPDSTPAATAAQLWGNLVHHEQPAAAADAWEQLLLHVLNASSNFSEIEAYLTLAQIIHKQRALAAIAAGDQAAVTRELELCEQLLPGDIKLVIGLATELDRAGNKALADKLLEQSLAIHQTTLDEFPRSATYFNNAAWVCARTQRQLDRALQLAEKAVSLVPSEASYQDTLAEVHFQRGDREAALTAANKAAELAPHSPLYATRLEHFKSGEVKTLDAIEDQ